jgi:hypothetical protein
MDKLSTHEYSMLFSKVRRSGVQYRLSKIRLLEDKEKNQYPYWLFDSCPCWDNRIELVEAEMDLCKTVGINRTKACRSAGLTNMLKDNPANEEFNEINGIAGELAYAKRYSLYPSGQFETSPRKAALDTGDFLHDGVSVDVKTTRYSTGRLTLSDWKHVEKVDVRCLITGNFLRSSNYRIRGFMTTRDMTSPSRYSLLFDNAPGKQFIANQNELYSMEEAFLRIKSQAMV